MSDITLEWSEWFDWNIIQDQTSNTKSMIPLKSGVYQVKRINTSEMLTIGKSTNLNKRIIRGLILGKMRHSSGKKIRKNEDTSNIAIRWAETEIPTTVEEQLHKLQIEENGINVYIFNKEEEKWGFHSKFIIIDNSISIIGSENLNERSMRRNLEIGLLTKIRTKELLNIYKKIHFHSRRSYNGGESQ